MKSAGNGADCDAWRRELMAEIDELPAEHRRFFFGLSYRRDPLYRLLMLMHPDGLSEAEIGYAYAMTKQAVSWQSVVAIAKLHKARHLASFEGHTREATLWDIVEAMS